MLTGPGPSFDRQIGISSVSGVQKNTDRYLIVGNTVTGYGTGYGRVLPRPR
jgi:hypothetical protein